jgi:N-acetylglucosaminyldiphosphoundecaprenol N-acetyl-beta-D-mannosaminyltransferase
MFKYDVMGFTVFNSNLDLVSLNKRESLLLNTISPNSYGIATKDSEFSDALKNSDFLVLDGVYFALASILLKGGNIKKNQGPDVFTHFMDRINNQKGKVFFLGASNETLDKIKDRSRVDYPNIVVGTYSPPFKNSFSDEDNDKIISTTCGC